VGIPPVSVGAVAAPRTLGGSALYDAGLGVLVTVPGDATRGNGLRAFALSGAPTGCGPATATHDCPLWATPLDGTTVSQPVIGDDGATLYVGTDVGTVYAVDATTGAVRWQAPVGSAVTGAVALADGTVFVPTASGDLVALAAGGCGDATCSPVWSGATGSSVSQQPAVAGEVVYTASADGSLHAFAAEGCGDDTTCPALWSESTGRQLSDGPIVSGGWLYVSFDSGSGTQGGGVVAYSL
jgi:outer membrane protein assembly factor BamB